MNHFINFILATILLIAATACGSDDSFHISGEVDGLGTRNLRFYYYDGKALKIGMASALDGKFSYTGSSKTPTLLTIATAQRNILGHIVVENGDAVELKLYVNDPLKMDVKGNKASVEYASFLKENSPVLALRDPQQTNRLIEKLINDKNSKLSTTAAFLLHYEFRDNPAAADSVLNLINADARQPQFIAGFRSQLDKFARESEALSVVTMTMFCSDDSLATFNPAKSARSLLVFTKGTSARLDSINAAIDSVAPKKNDSKIAIVNISLDPDTASWKKTLAEAPSRGLNLWAQGAVSSSQMRRFAITRLPLFIVADSTGHPLYRGPSVSKAVSYLKNN